MKTLTENQINFLLEYFFTEPHPGCKNIAIELINKGTCVVAGDNCIWCGGIGNFIKTKKADNAVGCLLYQFDLDYFLSSEWFKSIHNGYIAMLSDKKREIESQYEDICNL
jgi:hypothetical protein